MLPKKPLFQPLPTLAGPLGPECLSAGLDRRLSNLQAGIAIGQCRHEFELRRLLQPAPEHDRAPIIASSCCCGVISGNLRRETCRSSICSRTGDPIVAAPTGQAPAPRSIERRLPDPPPAIVSASRTVGALEAAERKGGGLADTRDPGPWPNASRSGLDCDGGITDRTQRPERVDSHLRVVVGRRFDQQRHGGSTSPDTCPSTRAR